MSDEVGDPRKSKWIKDARAWCDYLERKYCSEIPPDEYAEMLEDIRDTLLAAIARKGLKYDPKDA